MNWNKLSVKANDGAAANGWNENKEDHNTSIALMKTELSEAMDAFRENKYCTLGSPALINIELDLIDKPFGNEPFKNTYKTRIKGTLEEEISDIAIRILHYCGYYGLDLPNSVKIATKTKGLFHKDFVTLDKLLNTLYDNNSRSQQKTIFVTVLGILESIAEVYGFDLVQHINLKLAYNSTRGYKHGNKVL